MTRSMAPDLNMYRTVPPHGIALNTHRAHTRIHIHTMKEDGKKENNNIPTNVLFFYYYR